MSEPKLTSAVSEAIEPPKTFLQKLLDGVERVGNKVPHPAVIFFILAGLVILLSHLLYLLGTTVSYEVVNPQTHKVEAATATVNSLLSTDGIRFMLTSMVRNFANFGPVAIIFVVMVGVGLAEQAGLMTALIKKIVQATPRRGVECRLRRRLSRADPARRRRLSNEVQMRDWLSPKALGVDACCLGGRYNVKEKSRGRFAADETTCGHPLN